MGHKSIVIWGSGRIGRGFVADLFNTVGYSLILIDESQDLVNGLLKQKKYRVIHATSSDNLRHFDINNFQIFHTSMKDRILEAITETDLIALAVYPQRFKSVAETLRAYILARRKKRGDAPIDIMLCTNLIHAGPKFLTHLIEGLGPEEANFIKESVGIIESLVIRICPDPPKDIAEEHPFIVWTNGYPFLHVDKLGFKGTIPECEGLKLVENMRAEELRKIYTYNMCHAVLAYHGHLAGYDLLVDCLADPIIRKEAMGALDEVSQALQRELGFSADDMNSWNNNVLMHTNNPTIGDTVIRSAANPIRKLGKDDRLIGPMRMCLRNGIYPGHIIGAAGAAMRFFEESDSASVALQTKISVNGIRSALIEVTGLDANEEGIILNKISDSYKNLQAVVPWSERPGKAYDLGFEYERVYHGCGQCSFSAISEVLGVFDKNVFSAATGLCGGIGLNINNTCSAFTGAVLGIGMVYGRQRENFDGDRENKYTNFDLVKKLQNRFEEEYDSTHCQKIQKKLYGRAFDMLIKEDRIAFEEAGGHGMHGCTEVVAKACRWTLELLEEAIKK